MVGDLSMITSAEMRFVRKSRSLKINFDNLKHAGSKGMNETVQGSKNFTLPLSLEPVSGQVAVRLSVKCKAPKGTALKATGLAMVRDSIPNKVGAYTANLGGFINKCETEGFFLYLS